MRSHSFCRPLIYSLTLFHSQSSMCSHSFSHSLDHSHSLPITFPHSHQLTHSTNRSPACSDLLPFVLSHTLYSSTHSLLSRFPSLSMTRFFSGSHSLRHSLRFGPFLTMPCIITSRGFPVHVLVQKYSFWRQLHNTGCLPVLLLCMQPDGLISISDAHAYFAAWYVFLMEHCNLDHLAWSYVPKQR
jgi:hypothetical protein